MDLRIVAACLAMGCPFTSGAAPPCTPTEKQQCETSCSGLSGGKHVQCLNDCRSRCGTHNGGGSGSPATDVGVLPYDLVWKDVDLNGLPLNPQWWQQVQPQDPGLPSQKSCSTPWDTPCTRDAPTVEPLSLNLDDPLAPFCVLSGPSGHHVNWATVTYEGTAFWDEHSGNDSDDNVNVTRDDHALYTAQNPDYLHTEFSDSETISAYSTPWWKGFHDAIDRGKDAARSLLDNSHVIEIGVVGLDCAHGCKSELHPVYALAVEVSSSPDDNTWAIFARNLGNEGFCGPDLVPEVLLFSKIYLKLPWRGGDLAPTVLPSTVWEKPYWAGPEVQVRTFPVGETPGPGRRQAGVVVEIDVGEHESTILVDGELHLRWPSLTTAVTATRSEPRSPASAVSTTAPGAVESDEAEQRFEAFVAGLPPDVRLQVTRAMSATPAPPRMIQFHSTSLDRAPADFRPRVPRLKTARRAGLTAPNYQRHAQDEKVLKILRDNHVKVPTAGVATRN